MLKDILTGMPVILGLIGLVVLALNFPTAASIVGVVLVFVAFSGLMGSTIRG